MNPDTFNSVLFHYENTSYDIKLGQKFETLL